MILIYSYLSAFFQANVYRSVTIGDLAMLIILIVSILAEWKRLKKLKLYKVEIVLIMFVVWSIVSIAFVSDREYVDYEVYVNNIIRLVVYFMSFVLVPRYISENNGLSNVIAGVENILIAICILGLGEFALKVMGFTPVFTFIPNDERGLIDIISAHEGNHDRVLTIFTEPAQFAIFIGLYLSLLILANNFGVHTKNYKKAIVISFIMLILSLSLTGYMMIFTLIIMLMFGAYYKLAYNVKNIAVFVLIIAIVFYAISFSGLYDEYIFYRLTEVFNLEDGSATHRVLGMWEVTSVNFNDIAFAGRGFGQNESYYNNDPLLLFYRLYNPNHGSAINNVFVSILMQTGMIGLFMFIVFTFLLFKNEYAAMILLYTVFFSWGGILFSVMWFYFIVIRAIFLYKYDDAYMSVGVKEK